MTDPDELPPLTADSPPAVLAQYYRTGMLFHELMDITGLPYSHLREKLQAAGVELRSPQEAVRLYAKRNSRG